MSISYSYGDFTTKGHGVIEGDWPHKRKKRKASKVSKRAKASKAKTSKKATNTLENNYRHLKAIHDQAMRDKSSNI